MGSLTSDLELPLANDPFDGQFHVPPLRIGVLLLLAFAMFVLAMLRLFGIMPMEQLVHWALGPEPIEALAPLFQSAAFGISLIGAGVLIWAKFYKQLSRLQPGHWCLVVVAVASLLELPLDQRWPAWVRNRPCWDWLEIAVPGCISIFLWILAAVKLHDTVIWKALFAVKSLSKINAVGWSVASSAVGMKQYKAGQFEDIIAVIARDYVSGGLLTLLCVICFAAVILDLLYFHRRRDLFHWLGVAIVGIPMLVPLSLFCDQLVRGFSH